MGGAGLLLGYTIGIVLLAVGIFCLGIGTGVYLAQAWYKRKDKEA